MAKGAAEASSRLSLCTFALRAASTSLTQKQNCWNNNLSPQYFHFGVPMSEVSPSASGPTLMSKILMAVGAIYVLGSVIMSVVIFGKLDDMNKHQAATQASPHKESPHNNTQTRPSLQPPAPHPR